MQDSNPEDLEKTDKSDLFVDHMTAAMQGIVNLRWDDVSFRFKSMATIMQSAEAEKPLLEELYRLTKEFAAGAQQFFAAKSQDDFVEALARFTAARDSLHKLAADYPEHAASSEILFGIDSEILAVRAAIARLKQDTNEEDLLLKQQDQLCVDYIAKNPDHPIAHFLRAIRSYVEGIRQLGAGMQASREMDLDLARQRLQESIQSLTESKLHFSKASLDGLLFKETQRLVEGYTLFEGAEQAYIDTLRAAIIGDVAKSDIEALQKAERDFVDGADLVYSASRVLPQIAQLDFRSGAREASSGTRNLRMLCERSLKPREITLKAAPRVTVYFVTTAIALPIALRASGIVAGLGSSFVVSLLVVSLIVSLISTFGFEATRFVPLLGTFARFLPGAADGQADSGAAKGLG